MKQSMLITLMLCTLGFLAVAAEEPADNPFLGSWSMATQFSGSEISATMTLSSSDDGVTGEWKSQGSVMEMRKIVIEGNTLKFEREMRPGTMLHFIGELKDGTLSGQWSGPFGEMACSGSRVDAAAAAEENEEDEVANLHSRPIVERDGKRLLWAKEDDEGNIDWFDMTDSTIDPRRFQFGIGKDTIPSIDAPVHVSADDPQLAERGITLETPVLGVEIDGITRAYPVDLMSMHEVVNDRFGEKAFAVLW